MHGARFLLAAVALAALAALRAPAQEEEPSLGPGPDAAAFIIRWSWRDAGADWSSLYEALATGDLREAERLWADGVPLDDDVATAVHFTYGSLEVRAFIRRHGPAEIVRGDFNILDYILSEETSTSAAEADRTGYYAFPVATTYLEDAKDPLRYAADKAFDGRMDTAWVEGRDGSGIGQKIAFYIPREAASIGVVPGLADARWFSLNYRVKRARLTVHELGCAMQQVGYNLVLFPEPLATVDLALKDSMSLQRFPLPAVETSWMHGYLVGVLEILEVYPTGTWEDTCISEIQLFDAAGAPAQLEP